MEATEDAKKSCPATAPISDIDSDLPAASLLGLPNFLLPSLQLFKYFLLQIQVFQPLPQAFLLFGNIFTYKSVFFVLVSVLYSSTVLSNPELQIIRHCFHLPQLVILWSSVQPSIPLAGHEEQMLPLHNDSTASQPENPSYVFANYLPFLSFHVSFF